MKDGCGTIPRGHTACALVKATYGTMKRVNATYRHLSGRQNLHEDLAMRRCNVRPKPIGSDNATKLRKCIPPSHSASAQRTLSHVMRKQSQTNMADKVINNWRIKMEVLGWEKRSGAMDRIS
jgi:hypothetical protein